jgi:hypothetical protein
MRFKAGCGDNLTDVIRMSGCVEPATPTGPRLNEHILVYVNSIKVLSGDPDSVIRALKEHFTLKIVADPAKQPKWYLGAMIGRYQSPDGSEAWYMPTNDYLSKAIPMVEEGCDKKLHKSLLRHYRRIITPSWTRRLF